MLLEDLINKPKYDDVRPLYTTWCRFMVKEIDFLLKNSIKHTELHCARVMIFALHIAELQMLPPVEREILAHAAVFHDCRRENDWYDIGHGQRAAEHYRAISAAKGITFHPETYHIMAWHDRDDDLGYTAIHNAFANPERAIALYRNFKDADGLDRYRLGEKALDLRFLRTNEAKSLTDYAKEVLAESLRLDKK